MVHSDTTIDVRESIQRSMADNITSVGKSVMDTFPFGSYTQDNPQMNGTVHKLKQNSGVENIS